MLSRQAHDLNWLISAFAQQVPGVAHAIIVSPDGLLVALSSDLPRERADQLAAVTSGLASVTFGAAKILENTSVKQTVVEMGKGFFFVMGMQDGSILAALVARDANIGVIGFEMARVAKRAGELLTPALRDELRQALTRN